ncbi:IS1634 family transposase [Mesomycoplasma ovipneumoniae]|uniref:IS1634 family transposase n=1 Tax=Mesomycoplasma ovipneumoniae TaxID=29562 RepID=A0AAJ2P4N7_9BACT|nr:IS1634 family transposase [Mesomycoplasma ovipneumoniae]MDW2852403.1 IS1634 family transposase [Mesomycoplasma ovipneumoniae]MDW2861866.1 IS1634 family transposase [Mesomycoplasma ovipneumoniae]MDW2870935.1 IS1634 family transposase [Mesomycoplasma ovipneumoniae]MDW2891391.1 IS1634 family transposase [Mesomycoplasma ovipneumoniae]MDW2892963.1 IS1634 family transposase [Mesomycoplasma ovipneumoniae]
MKKQKLFLFNVWGSSKDKPYKYVGWTQGYGKGAKRWFSLGNERNLEKINPNAVQIIKEKLKLFSNLDDKDKVKAVLLDSIKNSAIIEGSVFVGGELIEKLIEKHNIFESLPKSRHKNMKEIFNYLISKRITDPGSIINAFDKKDDYSNQIKASKNSFYRLLDLVFESQNQLLNSVNKMVISELGERGDEFYFDSSTIYFETFERKIPGYSKEAKFNEDQIVIGLACDKNGIPFHIKVFKGNTADSSTLIPFVLDIESKYNIKNMTIIADRGMSTAANIRFLESRNYNFIISYRAKVGSQKFKNYLLDPSDYVDVNADFKYKKEEFYSSYKNKIYTENIRRRIITYSKKRAIKDRKAREEQIQSFIKKQNKDGFIEANKLFGKKPKYFKEISNMKFELDQSKIDKDKQFDGYYVYETNILNSNVLDIVEKYQKQWNIEANFRSLKGLLNIRPVFLRIDEHILAHTLLCFISLVILKTIIFKINKHISDNKLFENNQLTEVGLVTMLQKLRQRVEFNTLDQQITFKNRDGVPSDPNIWNRYDFYFDILINR